MRLLEEKTLVVIEIIILLSIGLLNIAIQCCDSKIDRIRTGILIDFINIVRVHGESLDERQKALTYLFAEVENLEATVNKKAEDDRSENEKVNEIINKYLKKEISANEYSHQRANFHTEQAFMISEIYGKKLKELNDKMNSKPMWFMLKNVLTSLQIVAVLVAVYLYISIIKSIRTRT